MNESELSHQLSELGRVYDDLKGPPLEIGICGGAALILTGLVKRTTTDVDILYPLSLPNQFWEAVEIVAQNHGLPPNWINLGPKDLFTMGLPKNYAERAIRKKLGQRLTACFAGRKDQIYFKLYASADRGGYHVEDLKELKPTDQELLEAVEWCRSHDPSEGFLKILVSMLKKLNYDSVAKKIG